MTKIVTIHFDEDEWYPVITLSPKSNRTMDIPAELYGRAVRAEAEFKAVQKELGKQVEGYPGFLDVWKPE